METSTQTPHYIQNESLKQQNQRVKKEEWIAFSYIRHQVLLRIPNIDRMHTKEVPFIVCKHSYFAFICEYHRLNHRHIGSLEVAPELTVHTKTQTGTEKKKHKNLTHFILYSLAFVQSIQTESEL